MAKRKILTGEDPVLHTVCKPIPEVTDKIRELLDDMVETMRDAQGVGLAGPQVGVLRRLIVVETEPGTVYKVVNPAIVAKSGEQEGNEGCLSLPGKSGWVHRPMNVTVEGINENGEAVKIEAEGFLARAFCHEIDHLDGILYEDKAEYMNEPEEDEHEKMSPAAYRRFKREHR